MEQDKSFCISQTHIAKYSSVYQILDGREGIIVPISLAISGYTSAAKSGLLLGSIVGALEEYLLSSQYIMVRFLSSMFVGSSFAISSLSTAKYNISPKARIVAGALGAASGLAASFGSLGEYSEHINTIGYAGLGYSVGGSYGALFGGLAYEADRYSIANNYTNNQYLSSFVVTGSVIHSLTPYILNIFNRYGYNKYLPDSPLAHYNVKLLVASSLISSFIALKDKYFEINLDTPIRFINRLHDTYGEIIGEELSRELLSKQVIITTSFAISDAALKSAIIQAVIRVVTKSSEALLAGDITVIDKVTKARMELMYGITDLFKLLPLTLLTQALPKLLYNFLNDKIIYKVEDKITASWLCNNNPLILKQPEFAKFEELEGRFRGDIFVLTDFASRIFNSGFDIYTKGLYFIPLAFSYGTVDSVVFAYMLGKIFTFPEAIYGAQIGDLESIRKDYINEYSIIQRDMYRNAEVIVIADGVDYVKEQLSKIQDRIRDVTVEKINTKSLLDNTSFMRDKIIDSFTYWPIIEHIISTFETNSEEIYAIKGVLHQGSKDLVTFFTWPTINSPLIQQVSQSSDNIIQLIRLLRKAESIEADKIVYKTNHSSNCTKINNLSLYLEDDDKEFLKAQNLEFCRGNVYAIKSPSGSGKSSFVEKIKGVYGGAIKGAGAIQYQSPNKVMRESTKIFVTSQDDYFPKLSTLFEITLFPSMRPTEITKQQEIEVITKKLMRDLYFKEEILSKIHEVRDWKEILSGGEIKKIMIIRSILQDPDIIIFDEIFNGMDNNAITTAQKIIKNYLNQSTIIIIDHHAKNHNTNNFYDGICYNFENGFAKQMIFGEADNNYFTQIISNEEVNVIAPIEFS